MTSAGKSEDENDEKTEEGEKEKEKVAQRHQMVSGSLALHFYVFKCVVSLFCWEEAGQRPR